MRPTAFFASPAGWSCLRISFDVGAALGICAFAAACSTAPASMNTLPLTADSVVGFLRDFEAQAEKENFDLVEDRIHENAVFRFNDGDFIGRAAIRAAFEKTWKSAPNVKKARFYLSEIRVLSVDHASAAATYTYNWEGMMDGKAFQIQGRGTRVLVVEGGRVQIIHEHLSRFPR
jgi:hypothetical protein